MMSTSCTSAGEARSGACELSIRTSSFRACAAVVTDLRSSCCPSRVNLRQAGLPSTESMNDALRADLAALQGGPLFPLNPPDLYRDGIRRWQPFVSSLTGA